MSETQDWFVFRGERNYLHSTSLFDFVLTEYAEKLGVPSNVDFTFVNKTKFVCRVEEKKHGVAGLVAIYIDSNCEYYLYETENRIESRVAYNEPKEGDGYLISGDRVLIPEIVSENSFIELAVGAYKGLLSSLFPEFGGKYVFARLVLNWIPGSSFEIVYKRKIAKKFFEGEVIVDGKPVGLIYFGV